VAQFDQVTQSACCFSSKFKLGGARSMAGFWCIKSHKPDIRLLVVDPDCVAIDNPNIARVYWFG